MIGLTDSTEKHPEDSCWKKWELRVTARKEKLWKNIASKWGGDRKESRGGED